MISAQCRLPGNPIHALPLRVRALVCSCAQTRVPSPAPSAALASAASITLPVRFRATSSNCGGRRGGFSAWDMAIGVKGVMERRWRTALAWILAGLSHPLTAAGRRTGAGIRGWSVCIRELCRVRKAGYSPVYPPPSSTQFDHCRCDADHPCGRLHFSPGLALWSWRYCLLPVFRWPRRRIPGRRRQAGLRIPSR